MHFFNGREGNNSAVVLFTERADEVPEPWLVFRLLIIEPAAVGEAGLVVTSVTCHEVEPCAYCAIGL